MLISYLNKKQRNKEITVVNHLILSLLIRSKVIKNEITWLAWHSMQRSMMWFLQMAQLSTTMSQAHNATADHFFTSNLRRKTKNKQF